jgi:hypothetical protein
VGFDFLIGFVSLDLGLTDGVGLLPDLTGDTA